MVTWPSEHDTIPDPTLPHELQLVRDYLFFELPLMARFEMGNGKWGLFAEAGISPNLYYGRKVTTKTDLDTQSTIYRNEVSSPSKLNLSGNISLGLHYRASERVALFFQPIFRYHFSPLVDAPIREHLWGVKLQVGRPPYQIFSWLSELNPLPAQWNPPALIDWREPGRFPF